MSEFFEISGWDELEGQVVTASTTAMKSKVQPALEAALVPMVAALEPRIPVRTGLLKESIQTHTTVDADGLGGSVFIDFGAQEAIARYVEYGHRAFSHHKDTGKHIQAHPFQRPAYAASEPAAIEAFEAVMQSGLDAAEVIL